MSLIANSIAIILDCEHKDGLEGEIGWKNTEVIGVNYLILLVFLLIHDFISLSEGKIIV